MAGGTKIEWTDETWNPIVGCSRVSAGCDNCYAVPTVHRGMAEQHRGLTVHAEGKGTDWTGEVRVVDKRMDVPLRWTRPRRIFVNSLSDLFHPGLDDRSIARVVAVMAAAPQHTFQVLTKRPQRMQALLSSADFWRQVSMCSVYLPPMTSERPLPNVWWGVSIESNQYAWRANWLRDTPAAVRWVSAEPLLGPLDRLDLSGFDWVVIGGESGPGSRPMHPDWARNLIDRCTACLLSTDRSGSCAQCAQVPMEHRLGPHRGPAVLFKQWGDWRTQHYVSEPLPDRAVWVNVETGETSVEAPPTGSWMQARYHGKRDAGRSLDGRTWDEYPT